MSDFILACTGGRHFVDVPTLWKRLDEIDAKTPISCILEGASDDVTGPYVGFDYWCRQWALARGKQVRTFHADWKRYGRAAGPIRNQEMLDRWSPQALLSGPGGRGTADMTKRAADANVRLLTL